MVHARDQLNVPCFAVSHLGVGNALRAGLVQFQLVRARFAAFLPKLGVGIHKFLFRLQQQKTSVKNGAAFCKFTVDNIGIVLKPTRIQ